MLRHAEGLEGVSCKAEGHPTSLSRSDRRLYGRLLSRRFEGLKAEKLTAGACGIEMYKVLSAWRPKNV